MSKRLAECQRVIGYHFADLGLLEIALTHSSVRTTDKECNERLEFLGDSVLGLAITDELYKRLPDQQEGELTRIKSSVVSRGALYRVSMRLGLPRFVEVAKGVVRRDELPVSLTANLVESIIGAIYLDAGFYPAREFILRQLGPEVEDSLNDRLPKNYKSLLQHEAQRMLGVTPVYRTLEEEGPDHRKVFTVATLLKGREYGRAFGVNKREAEQEAARHALEALQSGARHARRRRGEGGRGRGRSRDEERRVPTPRPSTEEESWRSWAERDAARAAPPAPYVVGPEPDEAWSDEPNSAPSAPRPAAPPRRPREGEIAAEADPDVSLPTPMEGEEPADRRRRRRGRRGGRGRRGEPLREEPAPSTPLFDDLRLPPDFLGEARAPIAPEADSAPEDPAPVVSRAEFDAPVPEAEAPAPRRRRRTAPERPEGARAPRGRAPRKARAGQEAVAEGATEAPAPPVEPASPPRAPSRPATSRPAPPRAVAPEATSDPSAAPPPAPGKGPGFGAGVVDPSAAASAPKRSRPSTPPPSVAEAPAVRKAPVAPRSPRSGGFGEGI